MTWKTTTTTTTITTTTTTMTTKPAMMIGCCSSFWSGFLWPSPVGSIGCCSKGREASEAHLGHSPKQPWLWPLYAATVHLCRRSRWGEEGNAGGSGFARGPDYHRFITSCLPTSSPSMHPAPAQTLFFATLLHSLCQNPKNQRNHSLYEFPNHPLRGARQHFHRSVQYMTPN